MPPRPKKKARYANCRKCLRCGQFFGREEHICVQKTANSCVSDYGAQIVVPQEPLDADNVALQGTPISPNNFTSNIVEEEAAASTDVFVVELSDALALDSQGNIERLETSVGENAAPLPTDVIDTALFGIHMSQYSSEPMIHCTTFCYNCLRESTPLYYLTFTTCPTDFTPVRRKFCNISKRRGTELTVLCNEYCFQHLTSSRNLDWSVAWPSVIAYYLKNSSLSIRVWMWNCLPFSLREQYGDRVEEFLIGAAIKAPLFRDMTHELQNFEACQSSTQPEVVITCTDESSFPQTVCPCGSWLFNEECNFLCFSHFIASIDCSFDSFGSDYTILNGMRGDYLERFDFLKVYDVMPGLVVHETKGLCMVVCKLHDNGLRLKYVHAPRHPLNSFISSVHADRLATVVPSLRVARTAKSKHSSYEYRLLRMTGNQNGCCVMTLNESRNMHLKDWENVHYSAEFMAVQLRPDMKAFIKNLMNDGVVSPEYYEQLTNVDKYRKLFPYPDDEELEKTLSGATTVDLASAIRAKEVLLLPKFDSLPKDVLKALVFNHSLSDFSFGERPIPIPNFQVDILTHIFVSCFMSSLFWHQLVLNFSSEPVLKLLKLFSIPLTNSVGAKRQNKMSTTFKRLQDDLETSFSSHMPLKDQIIQWMRQLNITCIAETDIALSGELGCEEIAKSLTSGILLIYSTPWNLNSSVWNLSENMELFGHSFELRCVQSFRHKICLTRYGGKQCNWWVIDKDRKIKKSTSNTFCDMIEVTSITNKWSIAIYYLNDNSMFQELRNRYLLFLSGQCTFQCHSHRYPLTSEIRNSGQFCAIADNGVVCKRRAYISCPITGCCSCVCRKHVSSNDGTTQFVHPREDRFSPDVLYDSESSSDEEDDACIPRSTMPSDADYQVDPDLALLTDSGFTDELDDDIMDSTNSGSLPQLISSNHAGINMNLFLAADVQPLRRRRGPVKAPNVVKRFVQNLVSTNRRSIPVNSIQAMICPSAYFVSTDVGSYPGALPTVLLNDRSVNSQFGFDGIEQHAEVLLKNHSLAASSNHVNQSFLFDVIVNKKLSRVHTNRILRGGLSELTNTSIDDRLTGSWDSSQSQRHVRELAASFKDHPPKLFITITCNFRRFFGVRKVYQAIQENYYKQHFPQLQNDRFLDCSTELKESVMQSCLVLLTRCWERALRSLLHMITKSNVLGTVRNYWGTHEYQPGRGNLSHFHLLVDCVESREELALTIACKLRRFNTEIRQFAHAHPRIIANEEEAEVFINLMGKMQTHNCELVNQQCHKHVDNHGVPVCRVRRYPSNIKEPQREELPQHHTQDVWELLEKLGMAYDTGKGHSPVYKANGDIIREKFVYPADHDEHVVPTNVNLACITQSNTNVLVTTPHMCASYTATYLTLKEKSKVEITAGSSHEMIKVSVDGIQHEKLPAVQIRLKREARERRNQSRLEGRLVGQPELVFFLLNFDYIHTSFKFQHVSTISRGSRCGFRKLFNNKDCLSSLRQINELNVPSNWKFTEDQVETVKDTIASGLTNDKISIFSFRPPQLLFIDEIEKYFKWFVRGPKSADLLTFVQPRPWIDGSGLVVKLLSSAVDHFIDFTQGCLNKSRFRFTTEDNLRECINHVSSHRSVYVTGCNSPLSVVVFSDVSPSSVVNFLTHVLLTFGNFETEISLFKHCSMTKAFASAGLIDDANNPTEEEILTITKRYVLQESIFKPGGSRTEDRKLVLAHKVFKSLLIDGSVEYDECPSIFHHSLQDEVTAKCRAFAESQLRLLILSFAGPCSDLIPSETDLLSASCRNPLDWFPILEKAPDQTDVSHQEQILVLGNVVANLDKYRSGQRNFIPFQTLIGPPGVGKSFLSTLVLCYAVAKGLNVAVTALAGETAARVGGLYINFLFKIPAMGDQNMNSGRLAETALQKLEYDLPKRNYLRSLDVLCVEEIGMICIELWNAIDLILQHVRESDLPFGGVFVLANGDALQLPPPTGTPIWITTAALVLFRFYFLQEFVRMSHPEGQRLLKILANRPLTEDDADEACKIISQECKFVTSVASVPRQVLRIFGTRAAEADEVEKHRAEILATNIPCKLIYSEDEVLAGTVWQASSEKLALEKMALEPRSLLCYAGAVMRFTACNAKQKQSQGQLCVVEAIPATQKAPMSVLAAPSGVRVIPCTDVDVLLSLGFYRTKVFFSVGHPHKIG